jgi:hypothetical protein
MQAAGDLSSGRAPLNWAGALLVQAGEQAQSRGINHLALGADVLVQVEEVAGDGGPSLNGG